MAREMTPQERAAELCFKLALLVDADTHMEVDQDAMKAITAAITDTRRAALLEAEPLLLRLDNALTDWLRCYAPEEFTDEQLAETRARLHGGTLAYIAELRRDIKVGLARLASEGE